MQAELRLAGRKEALEREFTAQQEAREAVFTAERDALKSALVRLPSCIQLFDVDGCR